LDYKLYRRRRCKSSLKIITVEDTYTIHPGNQIFVYGQNINDFHTLKKNAIWTVTTAALQEVDRRLRIVHLESQLAAVLARLDALENV